MHNPRIYPITVACVLAAWLGIMAFGGCKAVDFYTPTLQTPAPPELEPPRELAKVSLPTYRIKPPDLLQIEVLKLVPREPYHIEPYDVLLIRVAGTLPNLPIDGYFLVAEDGLVTFGPPYGTAHVAGLTIEEAAKEITRSLGTILSQPEVSVQLARSAGVEQLSGEYLVEPEGIIRLQGYGIVHVAGKTVTEVRRDVEELLARYFDSPQVGVDVIGYNSDCYYVIIAGARNAESIQRFPITGNETVLDALASLDIQQGITSKTIWVARAAPGNSCVEQLLPVDWDAIARGGSTATNYQLLPGDRLYIVDDNLVAANDFIGVLTRPVERLLSVGALGTSFTRRAQTLGRYYGRYYLP